MPGSIPQATQDQITPYLVAVGIYQHQVPAVFQGIEAAGWGLVNSSGSPMVTLDSAVCERVAIAGQPDTFLVGVKLGERGWLVWTERFTAGGSVTRSEPAFSPGAGDLLLRPATTGKWTVGTSAVGGTDQIT